MNLFEKRPEVLADQHSPQDLIAQLRKLDYLTEDQQQSLDYVLTDWVMTVLSRPDDFEGVLELHDLCQLALSSLPAATSDNEHATHALSARWEGFASLLEGKRLALRARTSPHATELLQEPKILALLANGTQKQSDLVINLNLTAGRISQLLAVLESRGKITRSRHGKESWVALTQRPAVPAPVPITAHVLMQERADYVVAPLVQAPPARLRSPAATFFTLR